MSRVSKALAWLRVPENRARVRQVFHDAGAAIAGAVALYKALQEAGVF